MPKKLLTKIFFLTVIVVSLLWPIGLSAQVGYGSTFDDILNTQIQPKSEQSINLAVKPLEPFVIIKDGQYSGFSIDLWESISKDIGITTKETREFASVKQIIDSVTSNNSDVGIAGISITAERENKVDFSYPMFRSGLSILTTSSTKSGIVPDIFTKIWSAIWNMDFGILALSMVLLSIIPAIVIYFVERRKIDGFLDTRNVFLGVFEAYCWCFSGVFGQQDQHPATKTGKLFGLIWMVFGVLFVSFFTAQVTANLTSDKLTGTIHSIEDIKDKKVATIKGTTSVNYLKENSIDYIGFESLAKAIESIDNKETVAVIYDKPALDFYAKNNKQNKYEVVGGTFTTEDYGIALPTNSPLRKKINEQLLKMYQNGEYEKLREKWFGKSVSN
jgi:polar amino acid transport system substrate-binding protein